MRIRACAAGALFFILSLSIPAMAQEKTDKDVSNTDKKQAAEPEKKTEEWQKDHSKLWVDLSGVMYLEWAYSTGFNNTGVAWNKVARWGVDGTDPYNPVAVQPYNYSSKDNNTFRMRRAYITLRKDFGDMFSVKVTTDISPTGYDFIYLKYGFIQFFKEFETQVGSISIKAQLGKIATPVVGITDYLNDLRWLGQNYLDNSKFVLNGKSYDNSADLGGLVSLNFFKLATIEYSYTNGEGYKFDDSETYGGKAHTLLVSANPVEYMKEVYVNFYARWEDTNRNKLTTGSTTIEYSGIDRRNYYGVGVAWYSDLIKAGLNFFMPETQFSKTLFIYPVDLNRYSPRYRIHSYLIDSWLNVNLGAVMPAGIIFVGRFAYGLELKSLLGNARSQHETIVLGGGAGYQFNSHFRMVLYYEAFRYGIRNIIHNVTMKDPAPNNNVYIKAEIKY